MQKHPPGKTEGRENFGICKKKASFLKLFMEYGRYAFINKRAEKRAGDAFYKVKGHGCKQDKACQICYRGIHLVAQADYHFHFKAHKANVCGAHNEMVILTSF